MVIGLTGKYAAGKGTVAQLLMSRGYRYHSLSDILREELEARDVPESRGALLELGNALREEGGPGVLAERLLSRLRDGHNHVVDSIRNPAEVAVLRRLDEFVLLGVDADVALRFKRLRQRGRTGDPEDLDTFLALEARETRGDNPNAQRLEDTFGLADHIVFNDNTEAALAESVTSLLEKIGRAC